MEEYYTIERQEKYALFKFEKYSKVFSDYFINVSDLFEEFEKTLEKLKGENKNLIFDMSEVAFCEDAGVRLLLKTHRVWRENNMYLILCDMNPMSFKMLRICQVDTMFIIVPTIENAIDYVLSK